MLAWARVISSDPHAGATPLCAACNLRRWRSPTGGPSLPAIGPCDLGDMPAPRDDQPSKRPLLDKLGVRPGMRVATLGLFAADFLTPLRGRAAEVVTDPAGCDIVFLAAGGATSQEYAPLVAAAGGVAVDKSSFFRMDPDVPLVVPEVNGEKVREHHGIIANPNCVATPLEIGRAHV